MVKLFSFVLCEVPWGPVRPLRSCFVGEQLSVWRRLRVARQNQLLLIDLRNPDVDHFTCRVLPHVLIRGHFFLNFSLLFPIWETYFTRNSPPLSNPFRMKSLMTRTIGLELAWNYATPFSELGANRNRLVRFLLGLQQAIRPEESHHPYNAPLYLKDIQ
jgi:hypothetical protein